MEAKRCDRCGKFYMYDDNKRITGFSYVLSISKIAGTDFYKKYYGFTRDGDIGFSKRFDLCPDCVNSLTKWVDEGKAGE